MFIKQGSAVMRIVAFAVAIAIVLGLASVMFQVTVSAEAADESTSADDTISYLGTIGNYQCIKFRYTDGVSVREVLSRFDSYADGSFVQGCVFGYMDGKFYTYTNNNISYQVGKENIVFNNATFYRSWLDNDKFKNPEYCIIEAQGSVCSTYRYDNGTDYTYGSLSAIAKNCTMADFPATYGTDFYAIFTSSASSWSKTEYDTFKNDVINNLHDSDYSAPEVSTLPTAEFLTFKGTDEAPQPLFFMDWINAGKQHPIIDFRIDDNGNHHQYALRISSNSKYVDVAKEMWDNQELKESISAVSNAIGIALLGKAILSGGSKFVLGLCSGVSLPIGMLFFNVPTNSSQVIHASMQAYIIKSYADFSYDLVRNLTSDKLTFSEDSDVVSKAVSICLSDYVSVVPYNFYKLEIIDTTNSMILSTAYFNSARGYVKSDSGYGTKVTDYDNRNNLDNDVNDDNGYINGDKNDGDKMDSDNPEDIINRDYNDSLANLDITNLVGSLRTAIASASLFFQACWSLYPAAFWSIILIGISLIIILRILGR